MSGDAGKVYLVGAGPGDPELITVRGLRLLREADVVLHDRLLNEELLRGLDAEIIDVGKAPGRHKLSQEEINELLIKKAREGKIVVRLKGGDPYLFGRGGEEALALREAGIPFEVVPGVTSAIAAPALAGIPVTHRGVSAAFTVVTGHEEPGKEKDLDWHALARLGGTLVVLMGVGRIRENTSMLIDGGLSPQTPAALIERGSWPDQRCVRGTLGDIAERASSFKVKSPSVLVVGDVVNLEKHLGRRRIAILRAESQLDESVRLAERYGFIPVPAPSISPRALELPQDIKEKIEKAECVVFTSSNGVEIISRRSGLLDLIRKKRVAAIGPKTAQALSERGVNVDVIPEEYSSAGLVEALRGIKKVLLLRSAQGSPALLEGLLSAGAEVEDVPVYEVTGSGDERLDDLIRRAELIDVFAFTSGSTVRYLMRRAEDLGMEDNLRKALGSALVVAIGPPTAAVLRELGVRVDLIPERYTFEGMLEAARREFGVRS
ncbi:MAG: uroporphyrinogen-III C-methyltransferase [Methanothrix sp.]|nr:uroporphyrinogen-III C-methyltransferase [Methanothrix sp.]MCX8207204.1 uroporphyrinogen-III C-methyltransferase [Methanothrix sp.]